MAKPFFAELFWASKKSDVSRAFYPKGTLQKRVVFLALLLPPKEEQLKLKSILQETKLTPKSARCARSQLPYRGAFPNAFC
ncbi:MAG: hypothetical protein SO119_05560 [Phascolarctobacterium sp.]|nr:hypothetical protein [Phascolarctobacterium sp.]